MVKVHVMDVSKKENGIEDGLICYMNMKTNYGVKIVLLKDFIKKTKV